MVKKAVQQGRSKRRREAYSFRYVECLSDARTKLAGLFTSHGFENGIPPQHA